VLKGDRREKAQEEDIFGYAYKLRENGKDG